MGHSQCRQYHKSALDFKLVSGIHLFILHRFAFNIIETLVIFSKSRYEYSK